MNRNEQVQLLLGHAFFRELKPVDTKALFSAGAVKAIPAGGLLFTENSPADGLFFVLSGIFEVRILQNVNEDVVLARIQSGEVIGEIGLLNNKPRTATIRAETDGFVWHLPAETFEGLLSRGDHLAAGLLKGMSEDLCKRFRAVVYEGASLLGSIAPETIEKIRDDHFRRERQ